MDSLTVRSKPTEQAFDVAKKYNLALANRERMETGPVNNDSIA
jgi:hypothetical protein